MTNQASSNTIEVVSEKDFIPVPAFTFDLLVSLNQAFSEGHRGSEQHTISPGWLIIAIYFKKVLKLMMLQTVVNYAHA